MLSVPSALLAIACSVLRGRMGTFLPHLLQKYLILQDGRIAFPGEVIYGHKEIFQTRQERLALRRRKSLRTAIVKIAGIILVVKHCRTLCPGRDLGPTFSDPLDAVRQAAKSLVRELLKRQVLL